MFSHECTHQYSREGAATGELKLSVQNGKAKGVQLTDRHVQKRRAIEWRE
jgi:hypothetical protein